jgi:hypothetical protein
VTILTSTPNLTSAQRFHRMSFLKTKHRARAVRGAVVLKAIFEGTSRAALAERYGLCRFSISVIARQTMRWVIEVNDIWQDDHADLLHCQNAGRQTMAQYCGDKALWLSRLAECEKHLSEYDEVVGAEQERLKLIHNVARRSFIFTP